MQNKLSIGDAGSMLMGGGILELGTAIDKLNNGGVAVLPLCVAVGLVLVGAGLNILLAYLQSKNVPVSATP